VVGKVAPLQPQIEDARPSLTSATWIAERLEKKMGRDTLLLSAFQTYEREAEAQSLRAATDRAFSRSLTDAGFGRKRIGGMTYIVGAELRSRRTLSVVA
jgi:hypothetical protein